MFVASTRSSTTTSVLGCRTSRESRACRSGWRTACASAVAGTVTRAPVSHSGEQHQHPTVVTVDCDQAAGVKGHPSH